MNQQPDFSDPDPADVPTDDYPDEGGIVVESGGMLDIVDDSVDCRNCAHYEVCGIIAAVRPMFEEWQAGDPEDDPPVDPTNLALICEAFRPVMEP